jgi:hypothetical protein
MPENDNTSPEEIQRLIQQKTLDALQEIKNLIEQNEAQEEDAGEESPQPDQKLYIRWKDDKHDEQ